VVLPARVGDRHQRCSSSSGGRELPGVWFVLPRQTSRVHQEDRG
jgi:hypothetical protein